MAGTTSMTEEDLDHKISAMGGRLRELAFSLARPFQTTPMDLEELRTVVTEVKSTYETLNAILLEKERRNGLVRTCHGQMSS